MCSGEPLRSTIIDLIGADLFLEMDNHINSNQLKGDNKDQYEQRNLPSIDYPVNDYYQSEKPLFTLDKYPKNNDQPWGYLSREALPAYLRSQDDKFLVNMWLTQFSHKQSIEKFNEQYLLRVHPEIKNKSVDELKNEIIKHVNSIDHPSELSEWARNVALFDLNFIADACPYVKIPKLITDEYTNGENIHENELRPWRMRTIELTTNDGSLIPTAILWRLNHLSPQLTGFFLENLLAYHIYGSIETFWKYENASFEINDFESMARGKEVKVFTKEDRDVIIHLLTSANFYMDNAGQVHLFRNYIQEGNSSSDVLIIDSNNNSMTLDKVHWPSYLHQLLYASISQSIQKGINDDSYDAINKFIDAFNSPCLIQDIERYSQSLRKTKYLNYLYRVWDKVSPFHSIEVSGDYNGHYMLGEMDYKFTNMIVDAKAVKDPTPEKWFAQIYFYRQMGKFNFNKLQVISFLNNKIYSFNEM